MGRRLHPVEVSTGHQAEDIAAGYFFSPRTCFWYSTFATFSL